jgi:hypothetical protein
MPDHNVWTNTLNPPPRFKGGLRAAGGHLHIGFNQADDELRGNEVRSSFIKGCDMILGVPSILIDTDKRRRTLYGKAGSARFKYLGRFDEYNGVEYRTLSNFWLKSEELMGWVFDGVKLVHQNLEELRAIASEHGGLIASIINTGNHRQAEAFIKRFGEYYE